MQGTARGAGRREPVWAGAGTRYPQGNGPKAPHKDSALSRERSEVAGKQVQALPQKGQLLQARSWPDNMDVGPRAYLSQLLVGARQGVPGCG